MMFKAAFCIASLDIISSYILGLIEGLFHFVFVLIYITNLK